MDVTLRLWQVVAAAAVAALAVGLMIGRYTAPKAHAGPEYFGVDVPSVGTIYLPTKAEADVFRAAYGRDAKRSEAQANVRAAVPAIEAYYADHGTYRGVTLSKLQQYDAGVKDVSIVRAGRTGYCLESAVGGATYRKSGPGGDTVSGSCR